MPVADLLNVPKSYLELMRFSFSHQDQHQKIADAIFSQKGQALPVYILDPMQQPKTPEFENWLENNQAAHNDFTGILGIDGNDLTGVDWNEDDQVESWCRLHFQEHYLAAQALGIG